MNELTVTVPIISDTAFEIQERFVGNLMLLSTDANVNVSLSLASIFIDDDDGMFRSSFGIIIISVCVSITPTQPFACIWCTPGLEMSVGVSCLFAMSPYVLYHIPVCNARKYQKRDGRTEMIEDGN